MTSRQRLITIIAITLAVAGAAAGFAVGRLHKWHDAGWTGMFYAPEYPDQNKKAPQLGARPGEVIFAYSGTPAHDAVRASDRVVTVNGVPIGQKARLEELDAKLRKGDEVLYRIDRNGRIFDAKVRLTSPLRSPYIVVRSVVSFGVAAVFIFVALLVFMRQPDDIRATVFYAFALVSAVAITGRAATLFEQTGGRGIVPSFGLNTISPILFFVFSLAYAPLILHLALIFPRERPIVARHPYVIRWLYAAALLAALLGLVLGLLFSYILGNPQQFEAAGLELGRWVARVSLAIAIGGLLIALQVIFTRGADSVAGAFRKRPFRSVIAVFALFIALTAILGQVGLKKTAIVAALSTAVFPFIAVATFPVFALVALIRSYRVAGVEEKRQVQWPLWGLLIAVVTKIAAMVISMVFGGLIAARMIVGGDWALAMQALDIVPTFVALTIPISFTFAILKYRLMNIDVIIRKTVVYAILSGAIIFVYLVLVGGLGTLLVNVAGMHNQTMVIASTLVVALLFVPLRNKLQTLVDRNLFRHKYDYPEALRAIGAETLGANDLNAFLASAAEKTQQALQNHAVVIFVNRHDELVAAAKVGVADSLIGALRIRREGFVSMLDRPFDPRRHALSDDAVAALKRVDAVLVVPVNTPGTPANGCIALAPKLSGAEFDVEDIDFLRSVADQIDIGIDRIRLQREDVDYEQARAIQQTLLPREMPRVAGLELSGIWQPARTMGGDYYDLLELSENELALCIGDVAGKGMPAALLMSGLQAAVRASASGSPRDLCERVRRVVVSSLAGGRFVTFFYATIDTASMKLRWCNAGHNAPVLARADGSVFRLDGGGPAFSRLTSGDKYEELETSVAPGDRIVLFTDGVSEAGAGADMFGEQRLEELVVANRDADARTLQQRIVAAATTHAGGELEDDLTLVVVAVGNAGVHAG